MPDRGAAASVRLALRGFEKAQGLLPAAYRRRFAGDATKLFEEMAHQAHRATGAAGVAGLFFRSLIDLLRRTPAEHAKSRSRAPLPRKGNPMDSVRSDLGYAVRALVGRPAFSLLVIVTLAVTIAAGTAVFSVVDNLLLRGLPYRDSDRLVMVLNALPALGVERNNQNPRDHMNIREMVDAFEQVAAIGSHHPKTMVGVGDTRLVSTIGVSRNLLAMLGVELALGRYFTDEDDHNSIIISHAFWQTELGGSPEVLETTINLNGAPAVIVGVLRAGFRLRLPSYSGKPTAMPIWNPLNEGWLGRPGVWDTSASWIVTVGRLRPGASFEELDAQLDAVRAHWWEDQPRKRERQGRPVALPLHAELVNQARPTLVALAGAVAFLVLIACSNVANLMLVRGHARGQELSVRAAIGGTRRRIVRLMFVEAASLAVVGTVAGAALAALGLRTILSMAPSELPLVDIIRIDLRVLAVTSLATAGATLLFGLLPAIHATRRSLAAALADRSGDRPGSALRSFRGGLVVAEIALSLVLLVGGGLLMRSFVALVGQSPGYQIDEILTFTAPPPRDVWDEADKAGTWRLNPRQQAYYRELADEIGALPGVESVSSIYPVPLGANVQRSTYIREGQPENLQTQLASSVLVTPGYFETMRIPLVAGRDFTWRDEGDKLVIDSTLAAKMWPGESPLGKRLRVGWWSGAEWGEVVGVVAPVRTWSLAEPDPETVYRAAAAYTFSPQSLVVRTAGDPATMIAPIRDVLAELHADVPLADARPLAGYADDQTRALRFATSLIAGFAGVGVVIALVGLYGVVSFVVTQRKREVGIRMALGADRSNIVRLFMAQGCILVVSGVAIGLAAAAWASSLLANLLYGVAPTDASTYVAVALLLVVVALLACWRPVLRATRVDPMRTLRSQ